MRSLTPRLDSHLPVLPTICHAVAPAAARVARATVLTLAMAGVLAACSSSTDPVPPDDPGGSANFTGAVDPEKQSILLESVTTTGQDGTPIHVDLLGSNLVVDAANQRVRLDVALRNADTRPLYPLVRLILGELVPSSVVPTGYDALQCPSGSPLGDCWYIWEFAAELLGDDGVLAPNETSAPRTLAFQVPGLESFAFAARLSAGLQPDAPRIAGFFFNDANENGRPDAGEAGFGGGFVTVYGPGHDSTQVMVGESGLWSVPVEHPGMYTLTATAPPTFREVHFTTPNPLQALLLPRADGSPRSYLDADFGVANGPDPGVLPPVMFVADGDSIANDAYDLLQFLPEGVALHLRVAFSGCGPDHPLQLFMVGEFMESNPVQARVVLSHDNRGELCAAYWEKGLGYDLRPILRRYQQQYGQIAPVQIVFVDPAGVEHRFLLQP